MTLAAACSSADSRDCQQMTGAEICTFEGSGTELEGSGFQPGSEIQVQVDGSDPLPLPIDSDGAVVAQGFAVLPGPTPQVMTITGKAANDTEVRFRWTVPAGGA